MTPDDLARREHQNFIETFTITAGFTQNPLVDRQDGVATLATGLPYRLFNEVIVEGDVADPMRMITAVDALRARGDRFVLSLRVGTDDRFIEVADRTGLVAISTTPWLIGMAWHPLPDPGSVPLRKRADHEIRRVVDRAGIEDHILTAAAGFGMPESVIRALVSPRLLELAHVAVYVGYAEGTPVTTGLGVRTGQTIGVYNISTVESARRRGLGADMTTRIVADGIAAGCDVAVLQPSDMGRSIYEAIGFTTVVEYMGYIDPPIDG